MKPRLAYLPLAGLYGAGVALRNLFFDVGLFRPRRVGLPVISVGNVRAGGTGKTPFVVLLAKMLSERGVRPAVVTRGYGRSGRGQVVVGAGSDVGLVGDEPFMLSQKVSGPVVVAASKRDAAAWVADEDLADVIILDDGFQHRWLQRDLDIVLVRAEDLSARDCLLPAGYAREPRGALRRADCVVVTGCHTQEVFDRARRQLEWLQPVPVVGTRLDVEGVVEWGTQAPVELRGSRVVAFTGIGTPASFERTLNELGAECVATHVYPDHHWFRSEELARVEADRRTLGAERIVTTEKDGVRLNAEQVASMNALSIVRVAHEIIGGGEELREQVDRIVTRTKEEEVRDAHRNER